MSVSVLSYGCDVFAYRCVCVLKVPGPSASKLKLFGEASLEYAPDVVLSSEDDDDMYDEGEIKP